MTEEKTKLDQLLEDYRNGTPVEELLGRLTRGDLMDLKQQTENARRMTAEQIWEAKRHVRAEESKLYALRADYIKVNQQARKLHTALHSMFGEVFEDPDDAAQKILEYEQKFGVDATEKALRSRTGLFGSLQGWELLGLRNQVRARAQKKAKTFSYADKRRKYGKLVKTKKFLRQLLSYVAEESESQSTT